MTLNVPPEYEDLAHRLVAGTKLFPMSDGGLLWSRRLRCLYGLSPSATYICCLLHEGLSSPEAAAELARRAQVPFESAAQSVELLLRDWNRGESAAPLAQRTDTSDLIVALLDAEPAALRSDRGISQLLQLRGRFVAIHFSDGYLESLCRSTYEHLALLGEIESARTTIDVAVRDGEFRLEVQGRVIDRCERAEELAPMLATTLFWMMVASGGYWMAAHAAAVDIDGHALLLPAGAGSGKTTLTAGLLHQGHGYLTDDCVLLDSSFRAQGIATSLAVKESGVTLLQPLFPILAAIPTSLRRDGKRVRYLPPIRSFSESKRACDVGWIVFPRYDPEQGIKARRLGTTEALTRLGCLATVPGDIDTRRVEALVAWLSQRVTVEIIYGKLTEGLRQLSSICGTTNIGHKAGTPSIK